MLTEQKIQNVLHASRVVPVLVANPHGPLGLDHVAQIVAEIQNGNGSANPSSVRPLDVPLETWLKLEKLAQSAAKTEARPVSVSELAAAILNQFVSAHPW